ncbi:hypothetical protein AVEN_270260-1 [Araneus ventricosus]|uniref:Uncharacterized protein n=1 Tax=Araneus ventricosus TaxID=182803 RepID=A0A4Y2NBV8_ARAVE|nr:hypothetical protein AVEN_270260-1 [Araneus ventricosus]
MPRIKNTRKRKSEVLIEIPLLTESCEPSTSTGLTLLNNLAKNEKLADEKYLPSRTFSETLAEGESSTTPKSITTSKTINSTNSPDCMIIENSKTSDKEVEVIDLTDDCHQEKPNTKLVWYISTTQLANGEIRVNAESSEETCEVNADIVGAADLKVEAEQNKNSVDSSPVDNHVLVKNKINENCEVSDNCMLVASPPSVCYTDSLLYEPETFKTPLLKYLKINSKIDVLEISYAISVLTHLIKDEDEIIRIESEAIPDFTNSLEKFELCLAEKREELTNLQVVDKQSSYLEVDEISHEISSKELVNFKPNITNSDSNSALSRLEKFVDETQAQNSLHCDGLIDNMRQDNSTNLLFESPSKMSESSPGSYLDSHTIYFNSPMDIGSPSEDSCSSIIFLPSLDNKRSETSIEAKKNPNEELFSNDCLRQILGNAKSSDISVISPSLNLNFDPVVKPNIIIDESVFQNLRQINFPNNKPVDSSDVNEKNSEWTMRNYQNLSNSLPNENALKRKQDVLFDPRTTFEYPTKMVKISEDASISKGDSSQKLTNEEYKERVTPTMVSPHLVSYPHVKQTPSGPRTCAMQNSSSVRSLVGPFYPTVNAVKNQQVKQIVSKTKNVDPSDLDQRTSEKNNRVLFDSPTLESHSFSMDQQYPHQSVQGANDRKHLLSLQHFPSNAASLSCQRHHLEEIRPPMSCHSTPHDHCFSENVNREFIVNLLPTPPFVEQSHQLVHGTKGAHQPLLSFQNLPGNTSSLSQQIRPPMSWHSAPHDHYFAESLNREFIQNPPLAVRNSFPSLPLTPSTEEQSRSSIASNYSSNSLLHDDKKLAAANSLPTPYQSSSEFSSLIPKQLREDIGKNIIHTNDVYLIIIERNVDWILGIDKEIGVPKISKFGWEFQQVRDKYENHLMYYNTYFPLLLLECFSKISTALKGVKAKEDRKICKVVSSETTQSCVSFKCESFIRHSGVKKIPKDGHIVLVEFATLPEGSVRVLGYVSSSTTRAYSHARDHDHEILKYVNLNKNTDLMKIRITFNIVFILPAINLNFPISLSKLTGIKKDLVLNDALRELLWSPLCDAVLNPRNHNVKSFVLPRRQDTSTMTTVVQGIVESLNTSSPQLAVIESPPFTDSFLAILQIVEQIKKSNISGKILVCVCAELVSQMGMNLIETSSNLIIINKKNETLHEKLQSRVLDEMVSHLSKTQNIRDGTARSKVLQEADVLLTVTETCFYENVKYMAKDLTHCIIHDAHSFTEPQSLLPLLYGIRHLLLFGDPDESCDVSSKSAASLGYNKSLFHRAFNLVEC